MRHTLEPRKSQVGLCILYTTKSDPRPIPLFEEPEIGDGALLELMRREYDVYTAVASSDSGVVRFLSEPQMAGFREALEKCEKELADTREESFVGDDTPLLDKINAKDFNVKRNLSSSLDITRAMEFGAHDAAEESPAEPELPAVSEAEALAISAVEEITQAVSAASATTPAEEPAAEEVTVKETGEADQTAVGRNFFQQHTEQRGFADTVWPDDRHLVTSFHIEGNILKDLLSAVGLGEIFCVQYVIAAGHVRSQL